MTEPAVQGFHPSENFDVSRMATFLRQPEIYWAMSDAAGAPPEALDIESYLVHSHTWTLACCYDQLIIGAIQFVLRTSVCAEALVAFHPNCRGRIALNFCRYAITRAWGDKGLLKLYLSVPSDNKRALMLAGALGFQREGRLSKAMIRGRVIDDSGRAFTQTPPGLYDLILLGLSKGAAV